MGKCPGLYSNIGKKARDLLHMDYKTDHMFTLTTYTAKEATTYLATRIGDVFWTCMSTRPGNQNVTLDAKVGTNSIGPATTVIIEELAPGLKTIFNFAHERDFGICPIIQLELEYQHGYAGINTSIRVIPNPILNFSSVVGTSDLSFGTDVSIDTATRNLTKCNVGLTVSSNDSIASVTLNDKGETLNASVYNILNPLTYTAVAAEFTTSFSTEDLTLTIGTQHAFNIGTRHALDPSILVKARVNNFGKVSASLQYEWQPKSHFTITGEFDAMAVKKGVKIGLALALNHGHSTS